MERKKVLVLYGMLITAVITVNAVCFARNMPLLTTADINSSPQLASVPSPVLSGISPNPNTIGNVQLSWSSVFQVDAYFIYVDTSPITDIGGLIPIGVSFLTTYTDFEVNGTYYYAVTAFQGGEQSDPSNCQSVTIDAVAPTSAPILAGINPNPSGSCVSLTWSAISDVAGYRVFKNTTPVFDTSMPVDDVQSTSCQVDIYANGTYYFAVQAYNGGGSSPLSGSQSVTVIVYSPPAPILSVITPNPSTLGNVTLTWGLVNGAFFYVLYESTSPICDANITNHEYSSYCVCFDTTQTILNPSGTYYYAVIAGNNTGMSGASNCESVVVSVVAAGNTYLSGITPNPNTDGKITLSWSAASNAVGYYIFRNTTPVFDTSYHIAEVPSYKTTYNDTVENNGTYYYAVAAYNGGGMTSLSSSQSVVATLFPVPMNTYIGVIAGNEFNYTARFQGSGCPPGLVPGNYSMKLVVDNVTDYGRNATIACHITFYNATNPALSVYNYTQNIRVTENGPGMQPWFVNKNTVNKSMDSGLQVSGPNSMWTNVSWDDAGVIYSYNQYMNYDGDVSYVFLARVTPSSPPPSPTPTPPPETNIGGYEISLVVALIALCSFVIGQARKKRTSTS